MVGSEETIDLLLTALIAEGSRAHRRCPAWAKPCSKSLAKSVSLEFNRIQFTPDLLPSDVTGLNYFDQKANDFVFSPARHSATYHSPTRSTAPHRDSRACSSAWASARSPWTASPARFQRRFLSSPRRIPSKRSAPIPAGSPARPLLMRISMASPTKSRSAPSLQRFMKEEPLETLQSVCTRVDILALQKQAKRDLHSSRPARLHDRPRAGHAQLAEYRYGRQPARQPCARPCRARTPWCAAAHTSCRKTSRPSPCRCSPTVCSSAAPSAPPMPRKKP